MSSFFRVVLGFQGLSTIATIAPQIGAEPVGDGCEPVAGIDDPEFYAYDFSADHRRAQQDLLNQAYTATIAALGGTVTYTTDEYNNTRAHVTLNGVTTITTSFTLSFFYDPVDVEDAPEDAVLAVGVDTAFATLFPRSSPNNDDNTCDITAMLDPIAKAQQALADVFPIFADARIIVKMVHW